MFSVYHTTVVAPPRPAPAPQSSSTNAKKTAAYAKESHVWTRALKPNWLTCLGSYRLGRSFLPSDGAPLCSKSSAAAAYSKRAMESVSQRGSFPACTRTFNVSSGDAS